MKKIGILYGNEKSFPDALIEKINAKKDDTISAEPVIIDKIILGEAADYSLIIDRMSWEVPFYQGYLKSAALNGTSVINNPFRSVADEKFFNNSLAVKIGINVPRTVLLPSNQHPPYTNSHSFVNLAYPLDWKKIFEFVGFPAFLKPFSGSGEKNVYRVENEDEFFSAYNETGQLVMMLQEEIEYSDYFRCYCIDRKDVRIMQYDPTQPHQLRYTKTPLPKAEKLMKKIHNETLKINKALGYDFNAIEYAIKDGIPYAIDFYNPAPEADIKLLGDDNFEWLVESSAKMAVKRVKAMKNDNILTWGEFVENSALGK